MAQLTVVYWRDIPAQITVRKGRETAKIKLSARFQEAIDLAAMRANLRDSDSYLAEWRNAEPVTVDDDLRTVAEKVAAGLEAVFTDERIKTLVEHGGLEPAESEGATRRKTDFES